MGKILQWIGSFLAWLDKTTGSYVIALFIFALIVEIVLLPLSIKQQKNSQKTASIRPKEAAIRKKYAGRNDQVARQKMGAEIQELYQRENVNLMGGCLPLLLQLPIIIALYNIVINPLKYVVGMSSTHIKTIGKFINENFATRDEAGEIKKLVDEAGRSTIKYIDVVKEKGIEAFEGLEGGAFESLSSAISKGLPNFDMFGLNLANDPAFTAKGKDLWLLIVPVLTFVVYFLSMKISRKLNPPPMAQDANAGCSNNVMDFAMPLMSVFIAFNVPAAIGVYWIFKSVITTVKQFILAKAMPLPTFTEEDYKAAEKEILGKNNNKKVKKSENAGKVRSLHHIDDDDDFEDEKSAPKQSQKPETKNAGIIESAKLKDDTKEAEAEPSEDEENEEDQN